MLVACARIYAFPPCPDPRNRLSIRDKLDLHAAAGRIALAGLQCVLGRDRGERGGGARDPSASDPDRGEPHRGEPGRNGADPISHDFLQLLRTADGTTAWTFVRSGHTVRVWRGSNGADLGSFTRLVDAVEAALGAAPRGHRQAVARRRTAAMPGGTAPPAASVARLRSFQPPIIDACATGGVPPGPCRT